MVAMSYEGTCAQPMDELVTRRQEVMGAEPQTQTKGILAESL